MHVKHIVADTRVSGGIHLTVVFCLDGSCRTSSSLTLDCCRRHPGSQMESFYRLFIIIIHAHGVNGGLKTKIECLFCLCRCSINRYCLFHMAITSVQTNVNRRTLNGLPVFSPQQKKKCHTKIRIVPHQNKSKVPQQN